MKFYPERRHPRFDFTQFPWVFSVKLTEPAPFDRPMRVEAKNISEGGLKFLANRKFPLFSEVEISLFDRAETKPLATLQGKVVRVEEVDTGQGEKTFGIAVAITHSPPEWPKLLKPSAPAAPAEPKN